MTYVEQLLSPIKYLQYYIDQLEQRLKIYNIDKLDADTPAEE